MPNYFAHLTFGARVLAHLPEDLRTSLEGERAAFDLGCLGPDPLFFYHPATGNPARREGLKMHKCSALPAFRRLRAAVEECVPMSRGYAAGFLCHLALDSACHPYVEARAARGELAHLAMEAEFDRLLMERAGLDARQAHLPPPAGEAVCKAAALAYGTAGPAEFRKGYLAMRRDTALLARVSGTRAGRAAGRLCGRLPVLAGARGMILEAVPAPASAESSRVLGRLLERAVPVAAEQIGRFFAAVEEGAPLDPWLDRDFGGMAYRKTEAAPQSAPAW